MFLKSSWIFGGLNKPSKDFGDIGIANYGILITQNRLTTAAGQQMFNLVQGLVEGAIELTLIVLQQGKILPSLAISLLVQLVGLHTQDLHNSFTVLYVYIIDQKGKKLVHRNIRTDAQYFLKVIKPYRRSIVTCVECMFSWYWPADLCVDQGIPFVLGHALYMRATMGASPRTIGLTRRRSLPCCAGG